MPNNGSTLYLTRNGLLEPLGQSQVMSYLKGLSQDYQITLITFEKPEDLADTQAMAKANADCKAHGIDWCPKRFRRSPKLVAPAWSMFEMFWSALQAARRGEAQLIHARSYLPAAAAWAVSRLTGTPSGPAEILANEKYGRLVPVGHTKKLAKGIEEALQASHDTDALISRAAEFSPSIAAQSYLKVMFNDA